MKVSDQIKAAGFKSAKELARALDCTVDTLRNWEREKPERFRVMLAGAVECRRIEQMQQKKLDPCGFYAELFVLVDSECKSTAYAVFPDKILKSQKVPQKIDHPFGLYWELCFSRKNGFCIPSAAKFVGLFSYSDFLALG